MLVTHASQGLLASHVPMLLNPDEGPCGTLYGHLARANPHWQDLAQGTEALVIFAGEQAYISPTFTQARPTTEKPYPPGITWPYTLMAWPRCSMMPNVCWHWSAA